MVVDPKFNTDGELKSLRLRVRVQQDASAKRQIAEPVPLPRGSAFTDCRLNEYFNASVPGRDK